MKSIFLTLCALFLMVLSVNAGVSVDPPTAVKVIEKDFPLFKDQDVRVFYIDFELLSSNIKDVKIVEHNGSIAFQEDVSAEEVNAIYEVNYAKYTPGTYKLELHTYSGKVLNSTFVIE
jgi:hypothetical protein